MNLLTTANAAANLIVVIAVADMAIRVFGNPEHKIHSHPELFYIRKFVSSLVICGAVLNLITLSTPSWTEIVLNYGFAANYLFSCYYDRLTSSKHSKASREVSRVNASCGAGCTGACKASLASSGTRRKRPTSR